MAYQILHKLVEASNISLQNEMNALKLVVDSYCCCFSDR